MIINLMNKNLASVLLFLAISPGSKYSRKEIKEKTGINNVPLDSALNELLTFEIISLRGKLYSLNLENSLVNQIVNEIKEKIGNLPLKIQFILSDFVNSISKLDKIKGIILFGSYSKLIYSEKSDIDVAIVLNESKSVGKIKKKIGLTADKLSKKYKKEIQEHFFTEKDLTHKEDPLIKDILRNGRILI